MRVDTGGLDAGVAHLLGQRYEISAGLNDVRGVRVAQRLAAGEAPPRPAKWLPATPDAALARTARQETKPRGPDDEEGL